MGHAGNARAARGLTVQIPSGPATLEGELHVPADAKGDYCSDRCANAQAGGMDNECRCGHPECG